VGRVPTLGVKGFLGARTKSAQRLPERRAVDVHTSLDRWQAFPQPSRPAHPWPAVGGIVLFKESSPLTPEHRSRDFSSSVRSAGVVEQRQAHLPRQYIRKTFALADVNTAGELAGNPRPVYMPRQRGDQGAIVTPRAMVIDNPSARNRSGGAVFRSPVNCRATPASTESAVQSETAQKRVNGPGSSARPGFRSRGQNQRAGHAQLFQGLKPSFETPQFRQRMTAGRYLSAIAMRPAVLNSRSCISDAAALVK